MTVPAVLLSGHHAEIERWRRREALARTLERRPDLLDEASLDAADRTLLDEIRGSAGAAGTERKRVKADT
jgi:tRNA (guanine37-N1)-methyltransferase